MAKCKKYVFAVPSVGCDYLTAGKRYPVIEEDDLGFTIADNTGQMIFCTWKNSTHTQGGVFERKEKEI